MTHNTFFPFSEFNGSHCEIEKNDCPADDTYCANEGQCQDLVEDFMCVCPTASSFSGKRSALCIIVLLVVSYDKEW